MEKKLKEVMLGSVLSRVLIIGTVVILGMVGGYLIGNNTISISEISPNLLLLLGVGLGFFVGYVIGVARGILRVINVTQKEDVFLPTGKLKFDKSSN